MITLMCPSRGRTRPLHESLTSLAANAFDLSQVEVLVALDKDDKYLGNYKQVLADLGGTFISLGLVIAPVRWGYDALHRYFNAMASKAQGEWLMAWNDDARMKTMGWDLAISQQSCDQVLYPRTNHAEGTNSFPVWPAAWSKAWGHVSLSPNVDVWVWQVARMVGRESPIDVEVYHDRYDITGGHADMTYAEGRAVLGTTANHRSHDTPQMSSARMEDAEKVRHLLAAGK